jgi:hypothetical protein
MHLTGESIWSEGTKHKIYHKTVPGPKHCMQILFSCHQQTEHDEYPYVRVFHQGIIVKWGLFCRHQTKVPHTYTHEKVIKNTLAIMFEMKLLKTCVCQTERKRRALI